MFVLKNLILALATVLDWAIMIYIWIVIIRALISWVEPNPYNPIVRFLHAVTEPLLAPIRYYLLRGKRAERLLKHCQEFVSHLQREVLRDVES
jgi:uncharacterized protein YggT (Ycf19 family)